jgi:MFS family permease
MQLSPLPDLATGRRLIWTALAVTLVVSAVLAWHDADLGKALGDTDDAMRLVMVRDLMAGRGWWDQLVPSLQPPLGSYMHWSRLVDGGLAAMTWTFGRVLSPQMAETATRLAWPLMWIFPAVLSALVIARSLAGRTAVFVCAVLLATNIQLYTQFRPGRVDHHNIQIVMTLIAAACALAPANRVRWAAVAGAAAGLGLAVGIEAMAFQAIIGASFALRAALNPEEDARPARAYALALVGATLGFFAIQTPPWRWSLSVCDSIGFNLVTAIVIGGLGLAALTTLGRGLDLRGCLVALGGLGALAAAGYLALDPQCIHGPFAAVDPRMQSFWFAHIRELQSWPQMLVQDPGVAVRSITMALMALAGGVVLLVRDGRRPQAGTVLICFCVGLAAVAAANALRMQDYAFWFGMPVLGSAIAVVGARALRGLLLPTLAASLAASPICVGVILTTLVDLAPKPAMASTQGVDERCFDTANYAPLAALPKGVVLAEIDLGPFILANVGDPVLAAPYHRMSWGILAAHDAQGAPAAMAEAKVRSLNATYLVECPSNPLRVGPASLEADIRAGHIPAWLQPLSKPGAVLQIYRVLPTAATPKPTPALRR